MAHPLWDPWLWVPAPPAEPLDARSPSFIAAALERLAWFTERYHSASVTGLEHVPEGRALVVGNHNGGILAPDMYALMVAWWRQRGVDEPAYGLMHDIAFHLPGVARYFARLGGVPASKSHALTLLQRDAKVLVYPGGDIEAYRPHRDAGRIVFGPRRGFIRVALRTRSPILPVVSVGAHDAAVVLTDGRALVKRLGLKRWTRVEVLPVTLGLPWGLFVGPLPYLPWPVHMNLKVLPAMGWPSLGPDAADDASLVERCFVEVQGAMQAALTDLVRQGGFGRKSLTAAWSELVRGTERA